jgi:Tol biopolymer transport system component
MIKKIFISILLLLISFVNVFGVKGPKIIYPANRIVVPILDPTFSWKFSSKPDLYFEIKISEDQNYTVNVIYLRTSALSLHFMLPYLRPNKTYYWTIRATYTENRKPVLSTWAHEEKSDRSNFQFSISPDASGDVGYQPNIFSPKNDSLIKSLKPVFRWTYNNRAGSDYLVMNQHNEWVSPKPKDTYYRLQISTSKKFDSDLKTFEIKNDSLKLWLTIPYLKKDRSYYWRVKALYSDPEKETPKESGWTFIKGQADSPFSFKIDQNPSGTFGFDEGQKEEVVDPSILTSVETVISGPYNSFAPAVSMDEKKLAFCSDREGGQIEIYVKNLEEKVGSGETRKTTPQDGVININPFWLFNNIEVGFYSNRYNTASNWELCSTNKGTAVTSQTQNMSMEEDAGNFNLFGSCSGDGKIVFTNRSKYSKVYTLHLKDLSDNSFTELRPGLFPNIRNDDKIVFAEDDKHGKYQICIIELDGHSFFNPMAFTNRGASDFDPAFSPDGKRIAFASTYSGNADIWIMNSDGTEIKQLTKHPMADRRPQWVGNETIIFQSNRALDKENIPVWNIYKLNVSK